VIKAELPEAQRRLAATLYTAKARRHFVSRTGRDRDNPRGPGETSGFVGVLQRPQAKPRTNDVDAVKARRHLEAACRS
jgi:hypothetical protein